MTKAYQDIFYDSPDGLTLYARDYGGPSAKPALLCMHGLTRNSKDFHGLALHLKDRYRVISVDQRGRGRSDYDKDASHYRPDIYCADMFALLAHLNLNDVVAIGTSMGGIMTMMMATMRPATKARARLFKAAILNDIGPQIDPAGLARIKGYVGNMGPFESWRAAASALKAQGPDVFPNYNDRDWMLFAQRTCTEHSDGLIKFDYDPAIAKPLEHDDTAAAPPDMWPIFTALSDTPLLTIRGELSDILSLHTVNQMMAAHPKMSLAEIPSVGHAPMLEEPESLAAIDAFLKIYV